jgi:hypothetical protein
MTNALITTAASPCRVPHTVWCSTRTTGPEAERFRRSIWGPISTLKTTRAAGGVCAAPPPSCPKPSWSPAPRVLVGRAHRTARRRRPVTSSPSPPRIRPRLGCSPDRPDLTARNEERASCHFRALWAAVSSGQRWPVESYGSVLSRASTCQAWLGASPQSPCQGEGRGALLRGPLDIPGGGALRMHDRTRGRAMTSADDLTRLLSG